MIRITTVAFILTLLVPPGLHTAIPGMSNSIGVMAAAAFWVAAALIAADRPYTLQRSDGYFMFLPVAILLMLAAHVALASSLVEGVDFGRFAGSGAILVVCLTGVHFSSKKLLGVPDKSLVRAANVILLLLALMGLAGAAGAPAIGPPINARPVVIFSEPSHFGLAMLPLLLFRTAIAPKSTQILVIGAFLLIAAALQSLTMVAGILAVAALLLRKPVLLLLVAPLAAAGLAVDITYYSDRLALSSESKNLSTLVFLQGWENSILNFSETHGFGVGFQQFGVAGATGEIAQKISQLLSGSTLSLLDGGTTASKLIGEFGVFGILALVLFCGAAVRSVIFIRRSQELPVAERDIKRLFFCALLTTYLIELFVRGVGYFSAGSFMTCVALLSLARLKRRARQPDPPSRVQTATAAQGESQL